ncbi:hypothetical protein [Aureispira anguillae]|uniref:Uncharacterized protein n=1 Tax=Aureispira anguillae TaxID=2864201 RepID=A0A916DUU2_9BACT|nr:hypothetical protein [Aureispira anguillae]BDS14424.1 hypothetical protein AsAng_0052040 [Aureispira anguillae]
MKNNEIDKELEEHAPFLSTYKKDKKAGFSVPTDYFETFEDRLMHRIQEEEVLLNKKTSSFTNKVSLSTQLGNFFRNLVAPQYAVGFSVCILLAVLGGNLWNDSPIAPPTIEGLLADGSIDYYIDDHIDEFSTEDIIAFLEADEVERIQTSLTPIEQTIIEPTEENNAAPAEQSAMDKALETVGGEDWIDNLTDEDLEVEEEDLFL